MFIFPDVMGRYVFQGPLLWPSILRKFFFPFVFPYSYATLPPPAFPPGIYVLYVYVDVLEMRSLALLHLYNFNFSKRMYNMYI
jgi:hypothetical protein